MGGKRRVATTKAGSLRFAQPAEAPVVVIAGNRGRLRGRIWLANDGADPIEITTAAITARVGAASGRLPSEPVVEGLGRPVVVRPGSVERATLTASVDRFTPPGAYQAKLIVNKVTHPAVLQITEDVALSLSPTRLVVDGAPGVEQVRHIVVTNTGNVSLAISRLGPVELGLDQARPTLLQRLGVLPLDAVATVATGIRGAGSVTVDLQGDQAPRAEGEEEPAPTIAARLEAPVVVAPGEERELAWLVTVNGAIQPGLRYRARVPLYTADITFVATPHQDAPAEGAPAARGGRAPVSKRPATATGQSSSRRAPRSKRRDSS
jgi:hypothetical protein